jgi:hypothetical protein
LGLASRKWPGIFPAVFGKYPGDALWALAIFLGLFCLKPFGSIRGYALLALGISFLVEISQLYQAPWINSIRGNRFGHLFLGFSFSWFDLLAYTIGIALGAVYCILIRSIQNSGNR